MALTGLSGAVSYESPGSPYIAEAYRQPTRAAVEEMSAAPGRVVERLLGKLARGLGTYRLPGITAYFQA